MAAFWMIRVDGRREGLWVLNEPSKFSWLAIMMAPHGFGGLEKEQFQLAYRMVMVFG